MKIKAIIILNVDPMVDLLAVPMFKNEAIAPGRIAPKNPKMMDVLILPMCQASFLLQVEHLMNGTTELQK